MTYPTRAYRTTPQSPRTAPDRTRRREAAPRRPVTRPPGAPSELGKPLPPGGGSKPFNYPPPAPPRSGGGDGPFRWSLGRNPWIAGFKFGWMLGDRLYDAGFRPFDGLFRWRKPTPNSMDFGGFTECRTGSCGGATHYFALGFAACPAGACGGISFGDINQFPVLPIRPQHSIYDYFETRNVHSPNVMRSLQLYKRITPGGGTMPYINGYSTTPIWRPVYDPRIWVAPIARPPGQPAPTPTPAPSGYADPLPEGSRHGPGPRPTPGAGGTYTFPGFRRTVHRRKPPGPRRKEVKGNMKRGQALITKVLSEITELNDVIDALYDSIAEGPCKQRFEPKPGSNKAQTAKQRVAAVYSCGSGIDLDTAIFNILWSQFIEDSVWATLGLGTKIGGRPVASNLGVNKLLSEAFGDAYADVLGDAEDWVRQKIMEKLGLTLI